MSSMIPVDEEIIDLAEFLKTFGDPTRLRILFLLREGELGVQAMSEELGLQQTTVSHQLKILRYLRLVRYRKEGRGVYYTINDDHIEKILEIGMQHIQEQV